MFRFYIITIFSPRTGSSSIIHLITDVIMTLIREVSLHAAEVGVKIIDSSIQEANLGGQEHLPLTCCCHFLNCVDCKL